MVEQRGQLYCFTGLESAVEYSAWTLLTQICWNTWCSTGTHVLSWQWVACVSSAGEKWTVRGRWSKMHVERRVVFHPSLCSLLQLRIHFFSHSTLQDALSEVTEHNYMKKTFFKAFRLWAVAKVMHKEWKKRIGEGKARSLDLDPNTFLWHARFCCTTLSDVWSRLQGFETQATRL